MLHTSQKMVATIIVIFLLAIGTAQVSSDRTMFRHDPEHSGKYEVCEGDGVW